EIMKVLSHDPPLGHLTTFGGNALSCVSSLAAINIITVENLYYKAIALGKKISDALSQHPAVREVRSRGLMMAVELNDPTRLHPIVKACKKEGLLVDWFLFNDRSIRIAPPLVISDEEIGVMCGKLIKALNN
ncbi:MAG: aminotransferase class III-fold pyridoxal phosphate-dependent enzyme, partial [Saprospiraceae bacterium]